MTQTKSTQFGHPAFEILTRMVFVAMCLAFLSVGLAAQESIADSESNEVTTEASDTGDSTSSTTPPKKSGESIYTVKSSFEIGVRGRNVNGNLNKYRSDLNYGAGVRLFDSSVLITAEDSEGQPFDTFLITGSGWSADPNGYARISMEKIGIYQFDGSVRSMTYFNNLLNFALNEHNRNTKRNMGDFDVTLFPQNDLRFRVGYSFNNNRGPATWTYDYSRDEFPIDSEYKTRSDDIRVGFDAKLLGFNLSFTEGYRRFDDQTSFSIDMLQLGNNPNPNASISLLNREIPEVGTVNSHSLNLQRTFEKKVDFTGRLIYSNSKSRFNMLEKFSGRDRFGNIVILNESNVYGNSERPNLVGDIGLSFFATDKLTISNTFSANTYRISGGNVLLESLFRTTSGGTPLPTSITNESVYRFTNFRRYINTIEASYDVNRYFSFYGGYRYTNRNVTLEHLDTDLTDGSTSVGTDTAKNTTNTFLGGFRADPVLKKWTVFVDLEHGEADNAFTRLSNYDVTNFRMKNRFRPTDELTMSVSFQIRNNNNPGRPSVMLPTAFAADTQIRNISASFDWAPNEKASFAGGYTYSKVSSETSVRFPVSGANGQGFSRYKLRSNFLHGDMWIRPHSRISFFGSYRITKDTGEGDFFSATDFTIDGNYPLSFQSPEARLTWKINRFVDFNLGYQYYKYNEKIMGNQNYSAHLPYGSLRVYFGGDDR